MKPSVAARARRACTWYCSAASGTKFGLYVFFSGSRERRHHGLVAKRVGRHTQVKLENLSQVHTRRYAERCQKNIDWTTVFGVWHVFFRQDAGNNALVTVTTGELVSNRYVTNLSHSDVDALDNAALELISGFAREYFDADNATALSSFKTK